MTEGQHLAIDELREVEAIGGGALEILEVEEANSVYVMVSVITTGYERVPKGLPLRERERFVIAIPSDFPFELPRICTRHARFSGFPHVQWNRHLCLYQSPTAEWDTSDGMFGFLARLDEWLRQGALNQLDPLGIPLHPPVAYARTSRIVIPKADTPVVGADPWYGLAHVRPVSEQRTDVVGWSQLPDTGRYAPVGAAILLAAPMPFEFPATVTDLVNALEARGVTRQMLFLTLQAAVMRNPEDSPLYVLIGTPMRGVSGSRDLKQHLTAWYVAPVIANGLRLSLRQFSHDERLRKIGERVEEIIWSWAAKADVNWCAVREDRPEIVARRDHESPLSWFRGRSVALWGCGAVGSPIAEFLTRAGIRKLILRDRGVVAPGLLVRQLYDDGDIGERKVDALDRRLRRIRDDLIVETFAEDLLADPLGKEDWTDGADLVIDATGSRAVLKKSELRWHGSPERTALASMVVGPRSERGLVVLVREEYSGGPADAARQAKLAACGDGRLCRFLDEFWPEAGKGTKMFQPEPGCSDPTFVGSAADAAALAGAMLNLIARDLADHHSAATGHFVSQPHLTRNDDELSLASFAWSTERANRSRCGGYDVRLSESAWQAMLGCIERSDNRHGPSVETGGLLFGERDDAAQVIWISDASDSPTDSRATRHGFVCGTEGTAKLNDEKRLASRNAVHFVGTWHTHPDAPPVPSGVDLSGMAQIVTSVDPPIRKALLLIVGHTPSEPTPATYVFSRSRFVIASTRRIRSKAKQSSWALLREWLKRLVFLLPTHTRIKRVSWR